jgi:hypothetical protein
VQEQEEKQQEMEEDVHEEPCKKMKAAVVSAISATRILASGKSANPSVSAMPSSSVVPSVSGNPSVSAMPSLSIFRL